MSNLTIEGLSCKNKVNKHFPSFEINWIGSCDFNIEMPVIATWYERNNFTLSYNHTIFCELFF